VEPVAEISPNEAFSLLTEQGALVLDVREPEEWDVGHAPFATLMPFGELVEHREMLPTGRPVLLLCWREQRSYEAARMLRMLGHEALVVRGGLEAWREAGYPVVGGRGDALAPTESPDA